MLDIRKRRGGICYHDAGLVPLDGAAVESRLRKSFFAKFANKGLHFGLLVTAFGSRFRMARLNRPDGSRRTLLRSVKCDIGVIIMRPLQSAEMKKGRQS